MNVQESVGIGQLYGDDDNYLYTSVEISPDNWRVVQARRISEAEARQHREMYGMARTLHPYEARPVLAALDAKGVQSEIQSLRHWHG